MSNDFQDLISTLPKTRLVEWWCVLNCKTRPKDLPSRFDSGEVFKWLTNQITKSERLGFWNGEFEHGNRINKYK